MGCTLRIALRSLAGQLLGVLAFVMACDIGPEFDNFGANDAFGRHSQPVRDGVAHRTLRLRVVRPRDGRTNQVPSDVGVVWSPSTFVALAPDGARRCPQKAAGFGARAFLEVAGIFMEHAGQHCIAKKVPNERIGVGRAESLRVALRALSPLRVAVIGLTNTRNDTCQQEGPGIDFTPEEKLKFLSR